jgi:hypothetical protein
MQASPVSKPSCGLDSVKLRIHNLKKIDIFCGKLMSFIVSDKYTSLPQNPNITKL